MYLHFANLILAATISAQAAQGSIPQPLFTPTERTALSQKAAHDCGYAMPEELIPLAGSERDKALPCLVRATVKQSGKLLPKQIEPGAAITAVRETEGLLVFIVQLDGSHPRGAQEEDKTGFDGLLSNRTCQDKWLGGLIDAGMDDGKQARTAVVYQFQDKSQRTLAVTAVAQCFDRQEGVEGSIQS